MLWISDSVINISCTSKHPKRMCQITYLYRNLRLLETPFSRLL